MAEHDEQSALFTWAEYMQSRYPALDLLYAIPNQAVGGDFRFYEYYKAEGLKPGMLDVCLPVARLGYHGLYIEFKFGYNKLTEAQTYYKARLEAEGYLTAVVKGWQEAADLLVKYLDELLPERGP